MGLTHPTDLARWQQWQRSAQPPTRRIRAALGATLSQVHLGAPGDVVVAQGGAEPRVVVVLESTSPSSVLALLAPVRHLDPADVAVVAPRSVRRLLPAWEWSERTGTGPDAVAELVRLSSVVLSTGHFLPLGAFARAVAQTCGSAFITVQHGLLTPMAPPLASGTTLLAWSEADGTFWRSGRADVDAVTVGSQLLWEAAAAATSAPAATPDARPVYLGQLHGAELPRRALARAAETFCVAEAAAYRPHPSETDRRSRAVHRRLERSGVAIDRSGAALAMLGAPVVGVFSTGVLEAAAAGLPAWVHFGDPPHWLGQFWERYGMSRWGAEPTPPPPLPDTEPARRVAGVVLAALGGPR